MLVSIRVMVAGVGFEPTHDPLLPRTYVKVCSKSSKEEPDSTLEMPSDLADVVAAWPLLPEPVRAGIVAMTQAVAQSPRHGKT